MGEIKQKKEKKEIESKLDNLIHQAQAAVNGNDLVKLEKLLAEIERYQGTKGYGDRKSLIKKLAEHFATLAFPKYQELTINSLNEFLRQEPPLLLDELGKTNQDFVNKIKSARTAEEVEEIKNSVANDINKGRSNKIVVNLVDQAKQAKTEDEKSAVRRKLSELENSDNQWIKDALVLKKNELEKIINSWILAEISNNNTDSSSSNKRKPDSNLPLIIFLAVVISLVIISGSLVIQRRMKKV